MKQNLLGSEAVAVGAVIDPDAYAASTVVSAFVDMALFDQVLSHTLFSFRTNRRIFRGLIRIQDFQRWHNIFDAVIDNSRWDLEQQEIDGHLSASFANMVGLLNFDDSSEAATQDPIGDEALALSKRLRREILRHELTTDEWARYDARRGAIRALPERVSQLSPAVSPPKPLAPMLAVT